MVTVLVSLWRDAEPNLSSPYCEMCSLLLEALFFLVL